MVCAALPLNVVPDAAPAPPLLNVNELATELAEPESVAVIVPAEKLPEPSRATIADAVLALVALLVTVNVAAPV